VTRRCWEGRARTPDTQHTGAPPPSTCPPAATSAISGGFPVLLWIVFFLPNLIQLVVNLFSSFLFPDSEPSTCSLIIFFLFDFLLPQEAAIVEENEAVGMK
jgi:hypothetical protein